MGIYDGLKCDYCDNTKKLCMYDKKELVCSKHYMHLKRYGEVIPAKERKPQDLIEKSTHLEMHFETGEVFLFDKDDREILSKCKWSIDHLGYLRGVVNGRTARFHRFKFNFPLKTVDHINRNKRDNRRENLRLCSQKENARNASLHKNNTSGHRGVEKTPEGKWKARITVDRKSIHLGHYDDIYDAIKVRLEAEQKYFKEFSPNHKQEVSHWTLKTT